MSLKFDLTTQPPLVEQPEKESCGICKRQISRYTCPTCNVPYCSLTCFRSEAHSECSETFYRKEIENDIHTTPSKSAEERRKILELLRKFEEENSQDPDEPQEDDDDSLAHGLEGINLEDAEADTLWSLLSPVQRDSFLKAIRDPSSELAQQLLSSTGCRRPWWESPSLHMDDVSEVSGEFSSLPQMMSIPQGLDIAKLVTTSHSLVYNVLALCLAYAYVTRRLSASPLSALKLTDPDRATAQDILSQTAPFLTNRKSSSLFESVDSLVTDVWSRMEGLSDSPSCDSFALLLADASHLLRPQRVSVISNDNDSYLPSQAALLALSDIFELFAPASGRTQHVLHKLKFYAAYLCGQDINVLRIVADEARLAGFKMQSTGPPR